MITFVTKDDTQKSADIIKKGGLVAVPTETVYGLSANGLDEKAVRDIYEVKGRPECKPISLLVSGMAQAEMFCRDIPEDAYALAEKLWPGPLTMIFKRKENVPDIVTAGGDTVGVRCPDHKATLDIIEKAGVPLATPSANISGMKSPKTAEDVLSYFDGKIPCVFDGGECEIGTESTVLDMTSKPYKILRQGNAPSELISRILGKEVV